MIRGSFQDGSVGQHGLLDTPMSMGGDIQLTMLSVIFIKFSLFLRILKTIENEKKILAITGDHTYLTHKNSNHKATKLMGSHIF